MTMGVRHADTLEVPLLTPASVKDLTAPVTRESAEYQNLSAKFLVQERTFNRQYASLYQASVLRLSQAEEQGAECIVVGTLYKQQPLKPSILQEVSEEANLTPQPIREKFVDEEQDVLILEDEAQRTVLLGDLVKPGPFVTGPVVGVRGVAEEGGKFQVKELIWPTPIPPPERTETDKDLFVCLVSGLGLSGDETNLINFSLFKDRLAGLCGDQEESGRVVHLIIAGNSMSTSTHDRDAHKKAKYLTRNVAPSTLKGMQFLDSRLAELLPTLPVDIMPGDLDPANAMLPQQPLHPAMFPSSSPWSSFRSVTNPHECTINEVHFLGTSGQNVRDISRYSTVEDPLVILESLLRWGHLAPTGPDTLPTYPFYHHDPFIIERAPHVFFAGNQSNFDTKLYTMPGGGDVRLISLPCFATTGTAVLVNLRNLEVQTLSFMDDVGIMDDQSD
ncbi:unnamed protein product [Cyprideis torosa]|uniref:Uncharacterized protein n=1 Tax=Cyprideis torosa TaxID=163714 RepID=A0A7R8ZKC1_9CRUS|nr:unnamed protein product [Cyprideis torosa]CAG0890512.1 unnamed protein product [Cyprideis torosa]